VSTIVGLHVVSAYRAADELVGGEPLPYPGEQLVEGRLTANAIEQ
jgi:hypothetical protein